MTSSWVKLPIDALPRVLHNKVNKVNWLKSIEEMIFPDYFHMAKRMEFLYLSILIFPKNRKLRKITNFFGIFLYGTIWYAGFSYHLRFPQLNTRKILISIRNIRQ